VRKELSKTFTVEAACVS